MEGNGTPQSYGKRSRKKLCTLDGGRISLRFAGSVNLNALGTTMVILGSFVLLGLIVSGVFFGKG